MTDPVRSPAILAAALLFLCCGCPAKPAAPPKTTVLPAPSPAAIECSIITPKKNIAVGLLENDKFAEAATAFVELAAATPTDPLATRNLVVARLQGLFANQTPLADVEAAVTEMLAREPKSAQAHWLAARVAVTAAEQQPDGPQKEAQRAKAVTRFDEAIALEPNIASLQYELFDALRYSTSPDDVARAHKALAEAHRLAPENLFVLVDLLGVQMEKKDPAIAESLAKLSTLVAPLQEGIQRRTRVDVRQFIDAATDAAKAETWPVVMARVRAIGAVLRPEEQSQSDRRRIVPHPLEFVRHDFLPTTCAAGAPSSTEPKLPKFTRMEIASPPAAIGELRAATPVDFDLDGKLDLLAVGSQGMAVLSPATGDAWQTVAALDAAYTGLVAVDFDRDANEVGGPKPPEICQDADPDVLASGPGGMLLLRNDLGDDGKRSLVNAIPDQPLAAVREVLTAIPADFDHDGDLDIALSTPAGIQLWAQQGAWRFVEVTAQSQMPPGDYPITTIVAVDLDRDVDLDLVVFGPRRDIGYLENLRHGELRYRLLEGPIRTSESVPLAILEANGDVSWDVVVGGPGSVGCWLGVTPDRGKFQWGKGTSPGGEGGDHLIVGDLNNDSAMDVLTWSAEAVLCLFGRGDGTFSTPIAMDAGDNPLIGVSLADVDADGDLDLLTAIKTGLSLYRNELKTGAGWLAVRVRGAEDPQSGRVNQYGVGSLLEVRTGQRYQAQVITGQTTHFGLGTDQRADSLRVLWTNGVPQVTLSPQSNQAVCERLTLKGSCPYLYTWTGERFEFFTDLLWAAPVGLQFAEGVLSPSRPWEYLLVSGEACRPKDGQYVLQITEELWEAAYFDEIELITIDHPADVEVFSNEKVGPAEMAELKVHTVRQRRSPVAARDQRGRDVLDQVRDIDGVYLKAFDRELRQGLTEPHYLELDLGKIDNPQRIMLYLTGWIYPTDVSLNIAVDHDPDLEGPKPPSLWTPDAKGEWREVRPFFGFPGGKTKTIAVDVTDAFTNGDYRLRLPTTHEIYWDAAFFTVDEPPAEVRMTPLELVSADVHPRGFSSPNLPRQNAPETYDYSQVTTELKWPPMAGRFTRYGDVRELLKATDDRLLVMASGDEVTVTFAMPTEPLPAGWKRDFFLHNVGWDKDADLHTIYGQTVEPLPYVAMPTYPYPPDQGPADTPAYREYLRNYQTRTTKHRAFWFPGQ